MTYTHDDLAQVLAKLDTLAGPVPTPDPAPVQGELHAHLVDRGRQVAQDHGLGEVASDDLATLGELTVIGDNPTVDPGLALHLDMIGWLEHNPFPSWREWCAWHQGHHHARNATCTELTPEQVQALVHARTQGLDKAAFLVGSAPEPGTTLSPEMSGSGERAPLTGGRLATERVQSPETADRVEKNVRPPIRDYPDEEWS
jgi:hypothetical protein